MCEADGSITFLFIGQILYPSFIAEMKHPEDCECRF